MDHKYLLIQFLESLLECERQQERGAGGAWSANAQVPWHISAHGCPYDIHMTSDFFLFLTLFERDFLSVPAFPQTHCETRSTAPLTKRHNASNISRPRASKSKNLEKERRA